MSKPCIITVAITGSLPRKKDNPAVAVTVEEQNASTRETYKAGATLVPTHVRIDRDTLAASNAALVERIVKICPEDDRHPTTVAEARKLLSLPETS